MTFIARRCLLVLTVLLLALHAALAQEAPVTVLAAASLTDAMKAVSQAWQAQGHPGLVLSFGSSGALARLAENGAPANVFASADTQWMDYLARKDLIVPGTRVNLLGNNLVLIVPKDQARTVVIGSGLDIDALLGATGRMATGDPASVPVGIYARQALTRLGLWDRMAPRLAPTEDVRGALLLVARGEAPAGIVYATDAAIASNVAVAGVFPAGLHDPVVYPFAVLEAGDTPQARALMSFLAGPDARAIFTRFGFRTP